MTLSSPIMGLFIGAGLALGGYFVSDTMLKQRTGVNTATVKGLSERVVPSDHAHMVVSFVTDLNNRTADQGFAAAETRRATMDKVLKAAGVEEGEIDHRPMELKTDVNYNNEGVEVSRRDFVLARTTVATTSPGKLQEAIGPLHALARDGIRVSVDGPYFQFAGLNDIKPDMLAEATENARIAANEFAADAGVTVGGIQTATQGGFRVQSLPSLPGIVEPGQHEVRVVTTITFYLEN